MKTSVFIQKTLTSLCVKAKGTGRKCVICSLLAGLCNGVNTAVATEPCSKPENDVQVVKVVKTPMTLVGDLITKVTGKKVPCPQTIMLKVADASDANVRETLKDNPYTPPRPPRSHQYW